MFCAAVHVFCFLRERRGHLFCEKPVHVFRLLAGANGLPQGSGQGEDRRRVNPYHVVQGSACYVSVRCIRGTASPGASAERETKQQGEVAPHDATRADDVGLHFLFTVLFIVRTPPGLSVSRLLFLQTKLGVESMRAYILGKPIFSFFFCWPGQDQRL